MMSHVYQGPGLTSDRNFQNSCEYYKKGDSYRTTVYGQTREEVLYMLQAAHGTSEDWQDNWVVTATKRIRMGLSPAWARVARRFNEYGDPE